MKAPAGEVLRRLRGLAPDAPIADIWRSLPAGDRTAFFDLLAIAADLPRLTDNPVVERLPAATWPALAEVAGDVTGLQRIVDAPVVPEFAEPAVVHDQPATAAAELEAAHCVTVGGLLDLEARAELDALLPDLRRRRPGFWGQLDASDEPELRRLFADLVAGDAFRRLTGFLPGRDEMTLTLSLQELDGAGIGWHRDLYWPREWAGRDVLAVLYALGDDSPAKGGAFLYWVPWQGRLGSVYRRRHEATVLWNCADGDGRLLHAVSGYRGDDRSRHLVILQCLRSE